MPAGNAYPSGHLFRPPVWDLLVFQLLRPDSSNLPCLYLTFHLEYPLVLFAEFFIRKPSETFRLLSVASILLCVFKVIDATDSSLKVSDGLRIKNSAIDRL